MESNLFPALQVAFDSTSISTYSGTILNAEYGKNKQGEELKQMNLCLVADKNAEEVLYAYEYQGSVNDVAALASPVRFGRTDHKTRADFQPIFLHTLFSGSQLRAFDEPEGRVSPVPPTPVR